MNTITEESDPETSSPLAGPARLKKGLAPRLGPVASRLSSKPFVPHPLFRGGHAQTLRGASCWRRRYVLRREARGDESRTFEVEPDVRVLAHCRWQADRRSAPTAVLVHGLEGSSESTYVLGTAQKAWGAGFNVVRMNVRNCGGTEHLAPTLYHSGMSGDVRAVVEELVARDGLTSVYLVGFSMGGNIVLKLAGEYGDFPPPELSGICAVSPPLDLRSCADTAERRSNVIYLRSFMRSLRRRVRTKRRLYPDVYDASGLRTMRTIRDFDSRFTAPHGGFADADDYYRRASSINFVPEIRVPTLVIHAQDDPLIPFEPFRSPAVAANPNVILLTPPAGGHVAFIARPSGGEDCFWAENRVVEFFDLLRSTN